MPAALCPTCSAILIDPGPVPVHADWATGSRCASVGDAVDWHDCSALGQPAPDDAWFLNPDGTPRRPASGVLLRVRPQRLRARRVHREEPLWSFPRVPVES